MIEIDHLSLHLPAGFEHRGSSIARLVAERLGEMDGAMDGLSSCNLDSLSVPSIKSALNATDVDIAAQVANGIASQLQHVSGQAGKGGAAT